MTFKDIFNTPNKPYNLNEILDKLKGYYEFYSEMFVEFTCVKCRKQFIIPKEEYIKLVHFCDICELENEPTINLTLEYIIDSDYWEDFCEWKGWNVWIINEGRASSDEIVTIPVSIAKQLGLI